MSTPKLRKEGTSNDDFDAKPDLEWPFPLEKSRMMRTEEDDLVIGDDDDTVGLEPDEDEGAEIEIPFDPSKIDIIVRAMSMGSLVTRLENKELDLTPDFQRHANLWDAKRKSRLIESILLGIPLPSFYLSEDKEGIYSVVDGLQRLCSIFHFMKPKILKDATDVELPSLVLQNMQYLSDLNGKKYEDLDRKFQRRISELEITANIIRASTPPAVKFNVFARLNQGGMPLNAQEIRNAIFPGKWRLKIKEMAESHEFKKATGGRVPTERQQDVEMVLRFVALWQLGSPFSRPANQNYLDEFLNLVVVEKLSLWNENKWQEVEHAFVQAINAASSIFKKHVFRKSYSRQRRMPINRGLFEAQLVVCGSLTPDNLEEVCKKRHLVEQKFSRLLSTDGQFKRSLQYGTGSSSSSNTRVGTLMNMMKEVINHA